MTGKHKYLFFMKKSTKKNVRIIFAKDLGMVAYIVTYPKNGIKYIWKLDTIMNYVDYKNNN